MNIKFIGLSLTMLSFTLMLPLAQSQLTAPCKMGNIKNTAYLLRPDDRRCEGITTRPAAGDAFSLKSLTIGELQDTDKLSFKIPKIQKRPLPQITVQSTPPRYYQLVPLDLNEGPSQWIFSWSNEVLRKENIQFQTLRSLALQNNIVLPVILGKPKSSEYNIRIYTGKRALEITLKILKTDKNRSLLYQKTLKDQPGDEVNLTWNGKSDQGKTVPSGIYMLNVTAQIEAKNSPPETRSIRQKIAHNIAWLQ